MNAPRRPPPGPPALSDWEVDRLADHLDELLGELLRGGDRELAAAVVGLIEGIERLHAEGMRRLAELLARNADLFAKAERDPVISGLFELYDLSVEAVRSRPGATGDLDPGGRSPTGDTSVVPQGTLVELRRRLDEHGDGGRPRGAADPVDGDDSCRVGTIGVAEIEDRPLCAVMVGRTPVLLVRTASEDVRAFRNACPGSPLPLHLGTLDEDALVCPWHGCRFDPRTGARLDGEGPPLRAIPVEESDGALRILVR